MKKGQLKTLIKSILKEMKESTEPSIGGSYADQQTTTGNFDPMQGERDPLFDPMINGTIDEAFRFTDYDELKNGLGFDVPTDVYWDSTYLGTIQSEKNGRYYQIVLVDTPTGKQKIKQNKQNEFKSKNQAAEMLHKTWRLIRKDGLWTTQEPLQEYSDPETRMKALLGRPDDALKLIFMWVKQGTINLKEFEELVIKWAEKTDSSQFGAS